MGRNTKIQSFQSPEAPAAAGGYSQAVAVTEPRRWVYVSGQIPEHADGTVPSDFEDQCRLVWSNLEHQLVAVGMGLGDLVKVTTYLSDRRFRETNSRIRREVLGATSPALTVVICDIYSEDWLLEIEAVAAA